MAATTAAPAAAGREAADYRLTPDHLIERIVRLTEKGRSPFVWGDPGLGKSDAYQEAARLTSRILVDIRALLYEPVDFRGLPYVKDGRSYWAVPDFLPPSDSSERYLIVLDELPAAPQSVQAALYQLVLDRRIGEYHLPEGAVVAGAGNYPRTGMVSHAMPVPLRSRFIQLEIMSDPRQWCAWAAGAGLRTEVIFFIRMRPELLSTYDPRSNDLAYACPRTWEFMSQIIDDSVPVEEQREEFRGTVGEGPAMAFAAFLQIWPTLPDPDLIFNDPEGAPIPDKSDVQFALAGAVARLVDDSTIEAAIRYAARLTPELGVFMVRQCGHRNPEVQKSDAWLRWNAIQSYAERY